MRRALFALMIIALAVPALAQNNPVNVDSIIALRWQKTMVFDVQMAQTAYSDSWTGGEAGTFTWVSNLNAKAERRFSHKFNLKSTLKLSYGQTTTQDEESKQWSKPKKSTDLIDWENVATFPLNLVVDPYLALRLESQFLDASYQPKKRYLNPLKLTYSTGVARNFYKKDKDEVSSRLGLALRQLFKNVITDTASLATTDSTLTDGGLESVTDAQLTLGQRVKYVGKLTLYKALFSSQSDEVEGTEFENFWKAIDVNFENSVKVSVSKIMSVFLYNQFLYDKEVSKKGRVKQTLGVGFTFTMW